MKVTGTGPVDAGDAAGQATETTEAGSGAQVLTGAGGASSPAAAAFVERLARSEAAATAAPTQSAGAESLHELAAAVDSGAMTPAAALETLVQQAVERQVGSSAPRALRERVESALRETLASEPFFTSRLRRLG